jgi:U3 small nucleolar RNA-associated protein 3
LQPSDEEVLGYDEDPSSEDDDLENDDIEVDGNHSASDRANDEDEDDNLRDWGTSKADYYNADLVETEADALDEEKEARRLHQKHIQSLTEADFGIDEYQRTPEDTTGNELWRDTFTERLPELEVAEDASSEEKTRILKSRYPEFEPLAKDFVELQKVHDDLSLAAKATEAIFAMKRPHRTSKARECMDDTLMNKALVATTKLRALSVYLGTVGMYFALLTSTAKSGSSTGLAMSPSEIRDHPVVQSLLRARQLWDKAKDIAIPELRDIAKEAEAEADGQAEIRPSPHLNETITASVTNGTADRKKKQRSKAERAAVKAQELAEAERQVRMQRTEDKLAELDTLVSTKRKDLGHRSMQTTGNGGGDDSDIGDEEALTAHEAAEKAQRKKSLRFYTSQIAQKSNKRGAASRDAGGDADLPYKERLKDRQARLMREAERRGQSEAGQGERLGNEGSGDDAQDVLMAKEVRGDDHDDEAYYDMISARTKQKKAEKKAFAEVQARAAAEGGQVYVEEEVGPDGKRAITHAIAKNKGLAPRRKKEVRNPRVKKKMQFSQKMKKLGSIRQVYRGGEGKGGYGGELTGIKTNVLKGVKL